MTNKYLEKIASNANVGKETFRENPDEYQKAKNVGAASLGMYVGAVEAAPLAILLPGRLKALAAPVGLGLGGIHAKEFYREVQPTHMKTASEMRAAPMQIKQVKGKRIKTYDAGEYFTKIRPRRKAKAEAFRSGIVGASVGSTLGALSKKGIANRAKNALISGSAAGSVNAGMTGLITYRQSKREGKAAYKLVQNQLKKKRYR